MVKANFHGDFKRQAVTQLTRAGFRVADVSKGLSVSRHSLYAWKKKFAPALAAEGYDKDAEIAFQNEQQSAGYSGRREGSLQIKDSTAPSLTSWSRGRRDEPSTAGQLV